MRRAAVVGAGLSALCAPEAAQACGVSATGVASCSLAEHQEAVRPRWAAGLGGVYTSTALRFDDSVRAEQTRGAVLAELAYLPARSLALQLGAGVAFGGSLTTEDGRHAFLPGPTASLGARWLVLAEPGYFVALTAGLSFVAGRTQLGDEASQAYQAYDLRLGAEAGLNLAKIFRPYLAVRAFGGPVFWSYRGESVTGTDVHHYQVGAGFSVALGRHVSLLAEGIPLGEQALAAGGGVSF